MRFYIVFICSLIISDSYSQNQQWKLVSNKDSLKIYSRKAIESNIKEVKVKAKITCELHEIVAALEDIPGQKEWLMRTKDAYFLERNSSHEFSYYISTDMPFPVKDRDIVVGYSREYDQEKNQIKMIFQDVVGLQSEKRSLVRIPEMQAYYTLTSLDDGSIDIEYYLYVDVGGALPTWVVNLAITKGPEATMTSLFRIIHSEKYKEAYVADLRI